MIRKMLAALLVFACAACQQSPLSYIGLGASTPTTADTALATVQTDVTQANTAVGTAQSSLAQANKDIAALQKIIDAAPPAPAPTTNESPDGTQISPGSGTITDASGSAWTLGADLTINENGKGAYKGWQSHQLVYHLHKVFVFGLDGNWYSWNGKDMIPDSSPLPPPNPAFYVVPGGSDTASGTSTAPFESLGRCQAAMANSSDIKQCNVSATGGGYYDFSSCSIGFDVIDDGEVWVGDPNAVLDGGGKTSAPFIMGPATNITLTGFKLQNFTGQ